MGERLLRRDVGDAIGSADPSRAGNRCPRSGRFGPLGLNGTVGGSMTRNLTFSELFSASSEIFADSRRCSKVSYWDLFTS